MRPLPSSRGPALEGERIDNEDVSALGPVAIHTMRRVASEFGDTYLTGLTDAAGNHWVTFFGTGVEQREQIAAALAADPEPFGPVTLVKAPTKAGRNVWLFVPADQGGNDDTAF